MASHAATDASAVSGRNLRNPPMIRMSWLSPLPWITEPAPRNSVALKKARVTTWKIAAPYAPTPSARNMKPSWLIVEYASTRLMSGWTSPTVAARSAVRAPTHATTVDALALAAKKGWARAIRNTPAVTIVAAWISAETGVGPSIASGNQTWSGSCALLPMAPRSSRSAIAVAAAFERWG